METVAATVSAGAPDLDSVLQVALQALQRSRQEFFAIADALRDECEEVQRELQRVRDQVAEQIRRVDRLTQEDRAARARLLELMRRPPPHDAEELRLAYEHAREVQVQLHVAIERERHLRALRDNLERRLKRIKEVLGRAEDLLSRTGFALELLTGNLEELARHVADLRVRQALGYTIIRAQEEERRRVARELHDGPAQLLAHVSYRIELCLRLLQQDAARVAAELAALQADVRRGLHEVRAIIFDLRPMALDDLGLVPALRSLTAAVAERAGIPVGLTVRGDERRLPPAVEIAAYRLVQEALHNACKHAAATRVEVTVSIGPQDVEVSVSDDGRGFDVEAVLAEPGDGFGLVAMRERVQLLRGSLSVQSEPGRGTLVRAVLPWRPKGDAA